METLNSNQPKTEKAAEKTAEAEKFVTEFNGIPYATIINCLLEFIGGVPAEGARYSTIYVLASHVRYICDNNPAWVKAVVPTFNAGEQIWESAIKTACKHQLSQTCPQVLRNAIANARQICTEQETRKRRFEMLGESAPEMPSRLPKAVESMIRNVPSVCRPSAANGIFAPLAAHLHEVKFPLIDKTLKEPTFMCINIAPQSTGKGSINKPVEYIMADIKKRDEENRDREQEWKDENNARGANKDREKRPKGLCVQMLAPDATNAAFLQRVLDAEGRSLYTSVNEIDELYGVKTNGKDDICKLLRLAFDNSPYGQERVGAQSVSGVSVIRWQINASGTIEAGRSFFRSHLHDGTLSRMSVSTIIPDDNGFVYGTYDERYAAAIAPYISRLNDAKGEISCPQALAMAERFRKECEEVSKLSQDTVYRNLSYRAVTIAYMKAMVLYIMQGRWSKEIEQFAEWSLRYDLWCKFYIFGEELYKREALERVKPLSGPVNMLAKMPRMFLMEEAFAIYHKEKPEKDMKAFKNLIAKWKKEGYIKQDEETSSYYKSDAYYANHEV